MRTPSPIPLLLVLALAVQLVAGCAGPAGDPAEVGDGAGVSGSTKPVPAPGTKAPAVQPDDGPAAPVRVIASGRVAAGVEPGCLVLRSDRGPTWLLVGGDRSKLTPGARVRVVGNRVAGRPGTRPTAGPPGPSSRCATRPATWSPPTRTPTGGCVTTVASATASPGAPGASGATTGST